MKTRKVDSLSRQCRKYQFVVLVFGEVVTLTEPPRKDQINISEIATSEITEAEKCLLVQALLEQKSSGMPVTYERFARPQG